MRCATVLCAMALFLGVQTAACASEPERTTRSSSLPMPAPLQAQVPTATAGSSASRVVTPTMMASPTSTLSGAPAPASPTPPTPASPIPPAPVTPTPPAPVSTEPKPGVTTPPMAAALPAPMLDPNVMFVWPETAPGQGSKCQPGTYVGTFTCSYDDLGITLDGPVTLHFEKSMNGEFLDLSDAKLEGQGGVFGFSAQLAGRLNCSTLEFSAEVTTGVWGLGFPVDDPSGTFTGTLKGTLDRDTHQIQGDWALLSDLADQSSSGNCVGPWMANLTP